MGVVRIRHFLMLAAGILSVSCTQPRRAAPAPAPSARTITFHNKSADRIQVYLVGDRENWLLGRLEPLETAHLRLPESTSAVADEGVVLAVLPGWSRSLAPRTDRRVALSMRERGSNLADVDWVFVNGQLYGGRGRP